MSPPLDDPAVSVGTTTFQWADLRQAPALAGFWAGQHERAADAPRRRAFAENAGLWPTPELIHELGVSFRRARRLLAADDLRAWLSYWQLSIAEWKQTLAHLAIAEDPDIDTTTVDDGRSPSVASDIELEQSMWAMAVVSGDLADAVHEFVAAEASVVDRPGVAPADGLADLLARTVTPEAVAEELDRRRLDWTLVELSVLSLAHPDAAREAMLCLEHDGDRPVAVAARAGTEIERIVTTVDELPGPMRGPVRGVGLGRAIGPFAAADAVQVVVVHDRKVPADHDPEALDAAAAIVRDRIVTQLVDAHMSLHAPLT